MSSLPTISLEPLLAEIPGDKPAGEALRDADDAPYRSIQEARRQDPERPSGVAGTRERERKLADWKEVIRLSADLLRTRSKDLLVAVWLTEALVNQYGFRGLRDGLNLLRELQAKFWNDLYPTIQGEDISGRIGV